MAKDQKVEDFYQAIYDDIARLLDAVHNIKSKHKEIEQLISPYKEADIALAKKLNGNAVKLLWYLRVLKKYGNIVKDLTYRDISKQLSMSSRSIVKSMKELQELNIVSLTREEGRRAYLINEDKDWKID